SSNVCVARKLRRKRRSCVTRTTGPSKASSARSSSSIAGTSRWFVGSSRIRPLTPRAASNASSVRARPPGEDEAASRRAGAAPGRVLCAQGRLAREERQELTVRELAARLRQLAEHHAAPDPAPTGRERQAAEQQVDQRRLAASVRPGDREPIGPAELELER